MTHLGLYFGCVFGGLFAIICSLIFVARATKWKPKPIKPVWAISAVCLAVLVAGTICSIAGKDIHILYWWLLGAPAAAIGIPLVVIPTTLLMRLFIRIIFLIFQSKR
jgi:hypothetical protein